MLLAFKKPQAYELSRHHKQVGKGMPILGDNVMRAMIGFLIAWYK